MSLSAWAKIEELDTFLHKGTAEVVYAQELQDLLCKVPSSEKASFIQKFHDIFGLALCKYIKNMDDLPARDLYKQFRVFDPKQAVNQSDDMDDYHALC